MAAAPTPPSLPLCLSCGGAGRVFTPPDSSTFCAPCAGTGRKRLKVALRRGTPGQCYWNILWSSIPGGIRPAPMHNGVFPKHHPVVVASGGKAGTTAAGEKMDELRALGYWASCFPEGDGITFRPDDETRSNDSVADDFEKVFGWVVRR